MPRPILLLHLLEKLILSLLQELDLGSKLVGRLVGVQLLVYVGQRCSLLNLLGLLLLPGFLKGRQIEIEEAYDVFADLALGHLFLLCIAALRDFLKLRDLVNAFLDGRFMGE